MAEKQNTLKRNSHLVTRSQNTMPIKLSQTVYCLSSLTLGGVLLSVTNASWRLLFNLTTREAEYTKLEMGRTLIFGYAKTDDLKKIT